jgi:hypothetical protein
MIIFSIIGPLLVLGLVGAGVVALMKGKLTMPMLAHGYTAVVLGIALVMTLVGGAYLLKAGLSELIGRDFSYTIWPSYYGEPYPSAETMFKDDIVLGITLVIIGGVVGGIHFLGMRLAAARNLVHAAIIERTYDIAMLVVGTAVGLTSVIMLINDLLRRYVVTDANRPVEQLPHPGNPLAFAVFFLPLWIYFGVRVWRSLAGPPAPVAPPAGELAPAAAH